MKRHPRYGLVAGMSYLLIALAGCAHMGRLTLATPAAKTAVADSAHGEIGERGPGMRPLSPMFGDTLIGLLPGTADSTRRFLGRLRDGYTADTLNIILFGDNRPGFRTTRLAPQWYAIRSMFSLNPLTFLRGVVAIPVALVNGLWPDLALLRDIPDRLRHMPTWGREREVMGAIMVQLDSLNAHGTGVAAVINSGDLVYDGRYANGWERFLRITQPLTSRVPYFPVAGNHERTDTVDGVANWRTATGLPVGGDRLYYCFDSADGWMRFIALDSNPIVDPANHWTRDVQVKYSEEEFSWLVQRIQEHTGPVLVVMHHPPFSAGLHHMEWQNDSVLVERRERMVRSLHDAGIAILVNGHQHAYQRALLTWPDAVLVVVVSGGGGAPLHDVPATAASGLLFSEYHVAGSIVKPENVVSDKVFNFSHLRLWFGGGDLRTYAVDNKSKSTLIDKVQIDLSRYGVPKIDQHKMPLPPEKGPTEAMKHEVVAEAGVPATPPAGVKVDSTSAGKRLESKPPPGKTHAH